VRRNSVTDVTFLPEQSISISSKEQYMSFVPSECYAYYGWLIEHSEFVRLVFLDGSELAITALTQKSIRIPKDRWHQKWALLGEGKIVFTTFVRGSPHTLTIRVYPSVEREGLGMAFFYGKNGILDTPSDHKFSAIVDESDDKKPISIPIM
jgi:hypothetical protein